MSVAHIAAPPARERCDAAPRRVLRKLLLEEEHEDAVSRCELTEAGARSIIASVWIEQHVKLCQNYISLQIALLGSHESDCRHVLMAARQKNVAAARLAFVQSTDLLLAMRDNFDDIVREESSTFYAVNRQHHRELTCVAVLVLSRHSRGLSVRRRCFRQLADMRRKKPEPFDPTDLLSSEIHARVKLVDCERIRWQDIFFDGHLDRTYWAEFSNRKCTNSLQRLSFFSLQAQEQSARWLTHALHEHKLFFKPLARFNSVLLFQALLFIQKKWRYPFRSERCADLRMQLRVVRRVQPKSHEGYATIRHLLEHDLDGKHFLCEAFEMGCRHMLRQYTNGLNGIADLFFARDYVPAFVRRLHVNQNDLSVLIQQEDNARNDIACQERRRMLWHSAHFHERILKPSQILTNNTELLEFDEQVWRMTIECEACNPPKPPGFFGEGRSTVCAKGAILPPMVTFQECGPIATSSHGRWETLMHQRRNLKQDLIVPSDSVIGLDLDAMACQHAVQTQEEVERLSIFNTYMCDLHAQTRQRALSRLIWEESTCRRSMIRTEAAAFGYIDRPFSLLRQIIRLQQTENNVRAGLQQNCLMESRQLISWATSLTAPM